MKYYKIRRVANLLTLGYTFRRYSEQVCHDCQNRLWRGYGRLVSPYHRGNHRVNGFGLREIVPLIDPKYSDVIRRLHASGRIDLGLDFDSIGTPIWKPTLAQQIQAEATGDVDFRSTFKDAGYNPTKDDQGRQGSCTSWDCIHHLTYWLIKAGKYVAKLSAAYCYHWIRKLGGLSTTEDTGGNMINVGQVELQKGAPLDSTMPYRDTDYSTTPSIAAEAEAPNNKLVDAIQQRVMPSDFKTAMIATNGPLNLGIPVDYAFENAALGGWVTNPDVWTPKNIFARFFKWLLRLAKGILGYHAVLLVAIITETAPDGTRGEFWIIMNSWGNTGDKAYWHLGPAWRQKYLNNFEAYKLTVKSQPQPTPTKPVQLNITCNTNKTVTGTWK